MNKKFYAAMNFRGFANTWEVHAFDSRKHRDEAVAEVDQHFDGNRLWRAYPIRKDQISEYTGKPQPFSGKFLGIVKEWPTIDMERFDGWRGEVTLDACHYPEAERVWQ